MLRLPYSHICRHKNHVDTEGREMHVPRTQPDQNTTEQLQDLGTNQVTSHSLQRRELTWRRVEWVVDKVGDEGSKAPVVAAVLHNRPHSCHHHTMHATDLEQVTKGHSSMRKAVQKKCLQNSLGIVHGPTRHGNAVYIL